MSRSDRPLNASLRCLSKSAIIAHRQRRGSLIWHLMCYGSPAHGCQRKGRRNCPKASEGRIPSPTRWI